MRYLQDVEACLNNVNRQNIKITSQREGYRKALLRIKLGVFRVNASLIRHF